MRRSPLTIGVDVGGTQIKLGLVRGPQILLERALPTAPLSSSPVLLQEELIRGIRSLLREARGSVRGVGVGIPGLVRYPQGVVESCANLSSFRHIPLKSNLKRHLRFPIQVDNDVHAMTLAEWKYGAGGGARNLVCMTLGTGVGGGLVLNGKLYRSRKGPSGEIGHLPISEKGTRCSCGGEACLERYVGNRDLLKGVRLELQKGVLSRIPALIGHRWERLTPELIDRACAMGDRFARGVWEQAGRRIGLVLVDVIHLLNPDRIVIGGGLAKAGAWLFQPIRKTVRERAMRGLKGVPILAARLGPSAGIIGAALLVQEGEGSGV